MPISFKCKLILILTIKIIISFTLLSLVLVITTQGVKISGLEDDLQKFINQPLEQRTCSWLCSFDYRFQYGENCCISKPNDTCKKKQECKDSLVQTDKDHIDGLYRQVYLMSGFVFVIVLLVATWFFQFLKSRRRRVMEANIQRMQLRMNLIVANLQERQNLTRGQRNRALLADSFIAQEKNEICVICYNEYNSDRVVKLVCNHIFHRECIQMWLNHQETCPTCRSKL